MKLTPNAVFWTTGPTDDEWRLLATCHYGEDAHDICEFFAKRDATTGHLRGYRYGWTDEMGRLTETTWEG